MSEDHVRHEQIAMVARELARSGRCKDMTEIEVGLILRDFGETHEILSDPVLRVELEMLCEESLNLHKSKNVSGTARLPADEK